ncbi:MAG: hypothetical protein ACKOCX_10355 [Planctomycetota bacterium]
MRHLFGMLLFFVVAGAACGGETPGEPAPFPAPVALRVETELFADGRESPVARSLTLFDAGVAWDFLELPADHPQGDDPAGMKLVEIVLHDPARERVVVIDPAGSRKTEIPLIRLERLSVSLAKWARSSDDRLVRWAGGPDFTAGFEEEGNRLDLAGPRVRYSVVHTAAESPAVAGTYRRFADTAILLKALLHPGGIPPFPRLAVNERLEDEAAIPAEVTLEIDSRLALVSGSPSRMRSVHKSHPRLLAADRRLIEEAQAHVAAAAAVDLATFMAPAPSADEAHGKAHADD